MISDDKKTSTRAISFIKEEYQDSLNNVLRFKSVRNVNLRPETSENIIPGSLGVQYAIQQPRIKRQTYLLGRDQPWGSGIRIQALTDTDSGLVFSKRAMENRYEQFQTEVLSYIYSDAVDHLQWSSLIDRPQVSKFVFVHSQIKARISGISSSKIQLALVRKVGTTYSFIINYQRGDIAYRVEAVLPSQSSKFVIVAFESFSIWEEKKTYSIADIKNISAADPNFGLLLSYNQLLIHQSHLIRNNPIEDIESSYDEDTGETKYSMIFRGRNGLYVGMTTYNPFSKLAAVNHVGTSQKSRFFISEQNCVALEDKCLSCRAGSHLSNGECHRNIRNCEIYAGSICLICTTPYQVRNNKCQSSCGLLNCAPQ